MSSRAVTYEVDELFRCPVVGLCLSCVEQRCLLKKLGVALDGLSRYDRHELLVRALGGGEGAARQVLGLLQAKYERRAAPLRILPEDDFVRGWLDAFAGGDCRAELWAAATRPLSDEARRTLYGRLRMALHGVVGEQTRLRIELELAGNNVRHKERRLEALEAERRALAAERDALRNEVVRLEGERDEALLIAASAERVEDRSAGRVAELERENAHLREELAAAEALLAEQEHAQAELRARVGELERHLLSTPEPRSMAEQEALLCDTAHCNEQCPSYDLCRQRVLIVGGIERMETLYRKLVEERGGVLEYHAGHMRGGARQLEKSLQRADVVLCPVNCNSHGACVLVKNLAKKYRKPVHMMPNFSLSAVAGVIGTHASSAA